MNDAPIESKLPEASSLSTLDVAALVEAIAERHGVPDERLLGFVTRLGAPAEDCLATVTSARATLLAAARGRGFYAHELRARIPMAPGLEPEVEVGPTVPTWEDGVFVEPKYFSFMQDAPFAAFNPVHRRKWRPHELLHGAVGFFWHPEMTRFEAYVGARLNELLPVAHWYGFDEIFRPRCDRHRGEVLYRAWCGACEGAVRPYWEVEVTGDDREVARRWARRGCAHFLAEVECCRREIDSGVVCPNPSGLLDSSSDAVGYLLGHWPRMRAWSFGAWAELFLRSGVDYIDDLARYADHVESNAVQLVAGTIEVRETDFAARHLRRVLQDLGYRALLALEWEEDAAVERAVLEALEPASRAAGELLAPDGEIERGRDALEELTSVLDAVLGHHDVLACGLDVSATTRSAEWETHSLAEGIVSALPETAARVDADALEAFRASDHVRRTGRLAARFASFLGDRGPGDELEHLAELARLEAWLAGEPRRDEAAERFAMSAEDAGDPSPVSLRWNDTTRIGVFSGRAVVELFGLEDAAESVELAAAYWRGELHVVFVDDAVRGVLDAVAAATLPGRRDTLSELMEAGLVVWVPGARSRSLDEQEL